jgi:hypothetical protein
LSGFAGAPTSPLWAVVSAWNHDYPRAEQNLSAIIRELTYLDIHDDGNEILMLDDPDLFKYPIAVRRKVGRQDRQATAFHADAKAHHTGRFPQLSHLCSMTRDPS